MRSAIWARSYSAIMPWNWRSSSSSGEPVGRVAQQHFEGALGGAVAQPLERRAGEHGARETLVAEHELLGDEKAAVRRQLTQLADLALDGPLVPLAIRRDAGVD